MIISLRQLLVLEAQEMLSAERQLVDALPSMLGVVTSPELRDQLERHLGETRRQLVRVQEAMEDLGAEATDDSCEAMEGMVAEAEELIDEELTPELLDTALALAALKIEHYEIAAYRGLAALAEACGADEAQRLFEQNLAEEQGAAERIERIATATLHPAAIAAEREIAGEDEQR